MRPLAAKSEADRSTNGWTSWRILAVLAIGIAYSVGVLLRWDPLNGMPAMYGWEWPWRQDIGVFKSALLLLAPFVVIAWIAWNLEVDLSRIRVRACLSILVLSNFCAQLLSVLVDPGGFELFAQTVASPTATSYYTDALAIQQLGEWLRTFHQQQLHMHSATHPAGPILFYYFIVKLWGSSLGALIGGCGLGLTGSLGVWVTYHFAGLWTQNTRTRMLASVVYALLPALIVFFPEFDQVYPIFTMLMILCWAKCLNSSPRHAGCAGVVLFISTFFAYNLLTAGLFLAYYGFYWVWREGGRGPAWFALVVNSAVALGTCVGLYLILWAAAGYNALASLRSALINQQHIAANLNRSLIRCAIVAPYDFAMGAGMIAAPILFFSLRKLPVRGNFRSYLVQRTDIALTLIGLGTILTIDASGLLRSETARIWLFLQPLIVVPVAVELFSLRRPWLLAMLGLQWWILVCLRARMHFIFL